MVTDDDVLHRFPRPIAWAWAEMLRARGAVARFHLLVEAMEEGVRYLTLIALARYAEVRGEGSPAVEAQLRQLAHPSFGDWVNALGHLDAHLASMEENPLGRHLKDAIDVEACGALFALVGPSARRRTTPMAILRVLVQLRNATKGHGAVSEARAAELVPALHAALCELLGVIPVFSDAHPMVVRRVERRRGRYHIDLDTLVGTARPRSHTEEVSDPGVLDPDEVFLWGVGRAPIQLSPFMASSGDHLLLFVGMRRGVPEYGAPDVPERYRPDDLRSAFETRAAFLIGGVEEPPTATRPAAAKDAYAQALERALAMGPITAEARALLRALCGPLGLAEAEAAEIEREHGIEAGATAATSVAVTVAHAAPLMVSSPGGPRGSGELDDVARLRDLAREADARDDVDAAIEALRQVLRQRPADAVTRARLIELLAETSQFEEAERVGREGIARHDHARVRAALAEVCAAVGTLAEAHLHASIAIRLDPHCPESHVARGIAYSTEGRLHDALPSFEAAIACDPTHLQARLRRAACGAWARPRERLAEVERLAAECGGARIALLHHASALYDADRHEEALASVQAYIARQPRNVDAWSMRAGRAFLRGEQDAGAWARTHALSTTANDVLIWWVAGNWRGLVSDDEARDARTALVARNPWHMHTVRYYDALVADDGAAAVRGARAAYARHPESIDLGLLLVDALKGAEEWGAAETLARELLTRAPDSPLVRGALANVVALARPGDPDATLDAASDDDALSAKIMERIRAGALVEARAHAEEFTLRWPSYRVGWELRMLADGLLGQADAVRAGWAHHPRAQASSSRLWYAQCLAHAGEQEEPLVVLRALRNDPPPSDEAADLALTLGDAELALHFADRRMAQAPHAAAPRLHRARALQDLARIDDAVVAYRAVIAVDAANALAWNNLATSLFAKERYGEALAAYRKAVELDEAAETRVLHAGEVHLNVAAVLLLLGRTEEADAEATVGLAHDEEHILATIWVERLLERQEGERARAVLEACLVASPDDVPLRLRLSALLRSLGDTAAARVHVEHAARLAPRDADVANEMGLCFFALGQQRRALDWFRRAWSGSMDDRVRAVNYAEVLAALGDSARADPLFGEILDAERDDGILLRWVDGYINFGFAEQALAAASAAYTAYPDWSLAGALVGKALVFLGRNDEALPHLEPWVAANPAYGLWLGWCYSGLQRWDDAIDVLQRSIAAQESSGDYRALFNCLVQVGETDWAREVLEHDILRLEPHASDAAALRAQLEVDTQGTFH